MKIYINEEMKKNSIPCVGTHCLIATAIKSKIECEEVLVSIGRIRVKKDGVWHWCETTSRIRSIIRYFDTDALRELTYKSFTVPAFLCESLGI